MQGEPPTKASTPTGAVFLSYASQDSAAAQRICEALRAAGIEVWFDQSELRGGDAWDQKIRREIRDCALFIPFISANTAARHEGYFRLEWDLADQRTHRIAHNRVFIVPVCLDATHSMGTDVPESFRRVQWTRLSGGETPPAFVERIQRLLLGDASTAIRPSGSGAVVWSERPPEKSLAVMPFANLSAERENEYFSDGLAEEILNALSGIAELRVAARTSSFSFKGKAATVGEIARVLGVTHILEGSVRKSGERLRITAQLVRADNGFHLWSKTYDRDSRDIFAVQDDIARVVSGQLQTTLLGTQAAASQQATSPEAYKLYLQARHLAVNDTLRDLDQSVALFRQVLRQDPNYAPAWAGLAFCLFRLVNAQSSDEFAAVHTEIYAAANRAIALNPHNPEAYVALAAAYLQYELNWPAAAESLAKVRALDPNNPEMLGLYGHLSAAAGRPSEAAEYFRSALKRDPLNLLHRKYLGRALHYARRPAESVEELRRAISLNGNFPGLHFELGRALLVSGDATGASAAFLEEPDARWRRHCLPLGYHAAGDAARAQAALADLEAHSQGGEFQLAEVYAFIGDAGRAFEWLDRAFVKDTGVVWSREDPLLASIEGDPRFAVYLKRLGMPPERND